MSKSGYYAWKSRPESLQSRRRRILEQQILKIFNDSEGRYGSPKVYEALIRKGENCSKNTVAEIMRRKGLKARVNRVYIRNPKAHRFYERIENLRRNKEAPKTINEVWVGDITYIRLGKRFMYLAAVLDVHSRRLVGWSISKRKNVKLTERALLHAIRNRHPPKGLIFHSDRGIEYCAFKYHDTLNLYGILPSVNRPGCCQDNAHMESFFHTLKGELLHRREIKDEKTLKNLVKGYITYFYNRKRLHSALGYCSPVEYEQQISNFN